jgi:hypothetical protein
VDGIESHPFHPEIEDDWLLVHQATDPKRSSSTSLFPKKGKRDREKALNSLSDFDRSQPSEICLALLPPQACGSASLMVRCATPDVRHPIIVHDDDLVDHKFGIDDAKSMQSSPP